MEYFSDPAAVDLWESVYDRHDIGSFSIQERMRLALAWSDGLELAGDSRVLDAGCGAGLLSREMSARGYDVFCLDFSLEMLRKAALVSGADGDKKAALFQGHAERLPFRSSSFDLIVSLGMVSYVRSFEKTLDEFYRVLAPSGVLIFSTLNKMNLVGLMDIPLVLWNRLRQRRRKGGGAGTQDADRDPISKRFYFTPGVLKSLRRRGFASIKYRTIPFRLLTFMGRVIPPRRWNWRFSFLVDKLPPVPGIGPLGGLCLFMARKSTEK